MHALILSALRLHLFAAIKLVPLKTIGMLVALLIIKINLLVNVMLIIKIIIYTHTQNCEVSLAIFANDFNDHLSLIQVKTRVKEMNDPT
ncbi:hypothetical protein RIR_jg12921.t1 [Rhizophagus irregularis DAOM 181602=DAOM 197198]|nr:hypothetical protein RIR_jg12921.t1 [Rhizophagus irregularis DAOM 181602=DAOM 197198]